jgi:hypothetical protein
MTAERTALLALTSSARGATAPTIPAVAAAPAFAVVPFVPAPIPAGALPAIIVPTVILVVEKVLHFLDKGDF